MGVALWLGCAAGGVVETAAAQQPLPVPLQMSLPVPLVDCPTNDQPGTARARVGVSMPAPVDGRMAEQVAFYRSLDSPGVYAPRGWSCHGWDGSNGTILVVTPHRLEPPFYPLPVIGGPAVVIQSSDAGSSGRFHVAIVAAQLFALIADEFIATVRQEHVISDSALQAEPHPNDQIQYISDRLVQFTTPANRTGLGTDGLFEPSDWAVRGLIVLNLERDVNSLTEVRVRLPAALNAVAATVLQLETTCIQLQGGCRGLPP
jgi:hypothetical protein